MNLPWDGVRTGFMLGDAAVLGKLAKITEDTYISPGYVAQAIAWEWCRRGLPPQIERLKKLYAPRLDACLAGIDRCMPEAKATKPDGGFFISPPIYLFVAPCDPGASAVSVRRGSSPTGC